MTLPRTLTAPLFAPLTAELVGLLRSLTPEQWHAPTVAGAWRVRDVAAHLLDGDVRKLSGHRDGHPLAAGRRMNGYGEVVAFINEINTSGVSWGVRLSPRMLTDLLATTGHWVAEFVETLDPDADSPVPVAWAGEERSTNWMDTGREYTERWHHQMQIREAVGAKPLLEARWLDPLLEMSVRALPRAYAELPADEGASIALQVATPAGPRVWSVVREGGAWRVDHGPADAPRTTVSLGASAAWRLFYNALPADDARALATIEGDAALAEPLFAARSVMV